MSKIKNCFQQNILMKMTFKRLLFIQILSSLAAFIGPLIDGIIVSDFLGAEYMAAFGIITPVTILVGAVSNIFNAGSQNLAGKYLGQGQSDKLNRLLTSTVLWGTLTSLVITVLLLVFNTPFLAVLGAEGETMTICTEYISMYAIGIIPTVLMPSLVGFLQLDNGGKTAIVASCVMTVSDVVFDILAVMVFKNGMFGIGLATTVSYILSIIVLMTHFLKKNIHLKFTLKDSIVKDIKKVFLYGLPAATFLLCNVVRVSATNNIILGVSDLNSVAAFSIQNTFRPVTIAFTMGTGITALLVCSFISGEKNRYAMRDEMSYILKLGFIISIILMAVVVIFAKYPFAVMFCVGQPDSFVDLVTMVIRMFAISIPFSMLNIIFIYYYQSMKRLLLSVTISVLQNVVFYLIAVSILSDVMGVDGIWMGYIISEALTLLTIFIITGIKNKHFPKSVHDFLIMPDNFGVTAENRINETIADIKEMEEFSEKLKTFCKNKKINNESTAAAVRCIEEITAYVIKNGDEQKVYVDIYLTYRNKELNIRIMDNSQPFDRKLLDCTENENSKSGGEAVRIVKDIAKNLRYNMALGMNVYNIEI